MVTSVSEDPAAFIFRVEDPENGGCTSLRNVEDDDQIQDITSQRTVNLRNKVRLMEGEDM
jgi:hypothetical protein